MRRSDLPACQPCARAPSHRAIAWAPSASEPRRSPPPRPLPRPPPVPHPGRRRVRAGATDPFESLAADEELYAAITGRVEAALTKMAQVPAPRPVRPPAAMDCGNGGHGPDRPCGTALRRCARRLVCGAGRGFA